jgi:hypothetical protein
MCFVFHWIVVHFWRGAKPAVLLVFLVDVSIAWLMSVDPAVNACPCYFVGVRCCPDHR